MSLAINLLLKDEGKNQLLRVVHLDNVTGMAKVFCCHSRISECGMPESVSILDLESGIKRGSFSVMPDTFLRTVDERTLTEREVTIREKASKVVDELVTNPQFFNPESRHRLIKGVCKKHNLSRPTVYKYVKKYFRNGLNKNALLPNFDNCGAPDRSRKSGKTPEIRAAIIAGYKKFVIDQGFNLRTAYDETITEGLDGNARKCKFTFGAFYYHGSRAFSNVEKKKSRQTDVYFDSNERQLPGRSNDIVTGPCQLYQIDSTKRDIKVVATIDRSREIGRPTFYVVIDAWSRAIIGVYITLDNPSYIAAAQALFISFRSKKILIDELGLGPEHHGWSTSSPPIELVADRAELLGPKADQIVNNFDIHLGNTAAYRADLKGVVEKIIDVIQVRVKDYFLGKGQVLKNEGQRMAKDTGKEACVTLNELERITWITVNEYNNYHWIDGYPLTAEMVRDDVDKIPAAIHKWGIANGLGVERILDENLLWQNLMEPGAGKVTKPERLTRSPSKTGIRFKNQDYQPVDERGFKILEDIRCAPNRQEVRIVYDPRNLKSVFWQHGREYFRLRLRGKDDVQFLNVWELNTSNKNYAGKRARAVSDEQDQRIKSNSYIKEIAVKRSQPAVTKNSRPARTIERKTQQRLPTVPSKTKSAAAKSRTQRKPNKIHKIMQHVND